MKSINQATILGNVTKDPELRYTPNGQTVINFSVATNRSWRTEAGEEKEAVEFHNIVFWGKAAEIISQFVKKGHKILVQGRLQTRSWEKDGVKRYTTDIVGQDFILLTPKDGSASEPKTEQPAESVSEPEPTPPSGDAKDEVKPEDIPF